MKKVEIIVFSVFCFLLSLTSLAKNFSNSQSFALSAPFDGKTIPENVYKQVQVMNQYQIIAEHVFRILFVILLLYIGWEIAYGFLGLRYIIPVTLCILIIPALIEFAFLPRDRTVWLLLCQDIFRAAIWIAIIKIYYLAWKRMMVTHTSELKSREIGRKSEIIVFSVFCFLLALTSFVQNYFVAKHDALSAPYVGGESIPKDVYNQMQVMRQYQTIPYYMFRTAFFIFLLYIGWKIAYGLLGLRYIIPVSLVILFIPQLIKFAFQPGAQSVLSFIFPEIIVAAIWIGIMIIYNVTWEKIIHTKTT